MLPLEMKNIHKVRHFSAEGNISLNYLLSRVNMNDVWELYTALETNMFEIEMLNKEPTSLPLQQEAKFLVFQKLKLQELSLLVMIFRIKN